MEKGPKSAKELGISERDWVNLAESLLLSRELASLLPSGELGAYHQMRVVYLEEYFGLRLPVLQNEPVDKP